MIFLLFFIIQQARADEISNCSVLDQADTTYYLTSDILDYIDNWLCMDIQADNVTLDCQGHTISSVDNFADGVDSFYDYTTIKNCVINDTYEAIVVQSNSKVFNNTIDNASEYAGIIFNNNNEIYNNTIINSLGGMYLYDAYNNLIYDNSISNNVYGGLDFDGSSDSNTIYNNFFNNTNNVYFGSDNPNSWNITYQSGNNIWNSSLGTIGGNYWTNPTGTGYSDICADNDSDGYCDNPYTLATDNLDYLPIAKTVGQAETILPCDYYISICSILDQEGKIYCLDSDIIGSDASKCMEIKADNITLNCQGHLINGNGGYYYEGGSYGVYVQDYAQFATIENCIVSNWTTSLRTECSEGLLYHTIVNNTFNDSVDYCGDYGLIANNTFSGFSEFDFGGAYNLVYNNRFIGDDTYIYVQDGNLFYNNLFNSAITFYGGYEYSSYWNTTYQEGINIIGGNQIGGNYWIGCGGTVTSCEDLGNHFCSNWESFGYGSAGECCAWVGGCSDGCTGETAFPLSCSNDFQWNDEETGCYWGLSECSLNGGYSDTCANMNNDSFCDNPYDIETGLICTPNVDCGDNTDYLPLTNHTGDISPPTFSNNDANNTIAGQPTLFSLDLSDNVGVSGHIFSIDNCTEEFVNQSFVDDGGEPNVSTSFETVINDTVDCQINWKAYANDTSNNWAVSDVYSFNTYNPLTYSDSNVNNTIAGQPTLFSLSWDDNLGLSGYIFSTNNTGEWLNSSWAEFSGLTNISVNVSILDNYAMGTVIGWMFYANDTRNNWEVSATYNFSIHNPYISICSNLDESGEIYYLTTDVSTSGTCMNIQADNITLDCQGHTIIGNRTGSGVSIQSDNVVVENCTISNYSNGIYEYNGDFNSMINNILKDNDYGIYAMRSDYEIINSSIFQNNSQYDIKLTCEAYHGCGGAIAYNNIFNDTHYIYAYNPFPYYMVSYNCLSGLNTTPVSGTNIVGYPYLGGNVWTNPTNTGYSDTCQFNETTYFCANPYTVVVGEYPYNDHTVTDYYPLMSKMLTFYSSSTNGSGAGASIQHSLKWTASKGLSGYIFSFDNCTGTFVNDTWTAFSDSDTAWSNATKTVNSTVGCTIRWQVYANDSTNSWGVSSLYSYVTVHGCPHNITSSDTPCTIDTSNDNYIVTENLGPPGYSGYAIHIPSWVNNTRLNCQGFGGVVSANVWYFVIIDGTSITVTNCNIGGTSSLFGAGIYDNGANNIIYNNSFSSSYTSGIRGSTINGSIYNNTFSGLNGHYGPHSWCSMAGLKGTFTGTDIYNNSFSDCLMAFHVSGARIHNNKYTNVGTVLSGEYGIATFCYDPLDNVADIIMYNETDNSNSGMVGGIVGSSTITNNVFCPSAGGISISSHALAYSNSNLIQNNVLCNGGISIVGIGNTILNNTISNSSVGIRVDNMVDGNWGSNDIYNNTIYNCSNWAISVGDEYTAPYLGSTIAFNNISYNANGIQANWSSYKDLNGGVLIQNNTFYNNIGYNILSNKGVVILSNNINGGENGIYLDSSSSSNSIIIGNIIEHTVVGVTLSSSFNNTIYNNLFNNIINVNFIANSSNYWNTTQQSGTNIIGKNQIGGNYWSGYSDTCSITTSIAVCGNNTDWLPLSNGGFCNYPYDVEANAPCGVPTPPLSLPPFFNKYMIVTVIILAIAVIVASYVGGDWLVVFMSVAGALIFFGAVIGFYPKWVLILSIVIASAIFAKWVTGLVGGD